MVETQPVFLGTVAIEPARWAHLRPSPATAPPRPLVAVSSFTSAIADAGFDGIEVWERHLSEAGPSESAALLASTLPRPIYSSYTSLDDPKPDARAIVGSFAELAGSDAIKFNVGNIAADQDRYADRVAEWLELVPPSMRLLCECHHGISIAEDPAVAAAIFDAAGPASRLQAIVHTHESHDHLRSRFDAYGDRITHVHVNFLDFAAMRAPRLVDIKDEVEAKVSLLRSLGFQGSWTIEFTEGVLTANDQPAYLLARAADDLSVLREALG